MLKNSVLFLFDRELNPRNSVIMLLVCVIVCMEKNRRQYFQDILLAKLTMLGFMDVK